MSNKQKSIVRPVLLVVVVLVGAFAFVAGRPLRLAEPEEKKPNISDSTFSPFSRTPPHAFANKSPVTLLEPQGNGYTYRRTITIDHTKVPNTVQTNFPVLISGTYSYLATVANGGKVENGNGYDVIFTSDSDCSIKLNHEVETYNADSGAGNYWVKVPTVSHTSDDTVFYMCYGNASITTDQSNKAAVWDSSYKGVWHLPNGTTLTVGDSTGNGNHLTNSSASGGGGQN